MRHGFYFEEMHVQIIHLLQTIILNEKKFCIHKKYLTKKCKNIDFIPSIGFTNYYFLDTVKDIAVCQRPE